MQKIVSPKMERLSQRSDGYTRFCTVPLKFGLVSPFRALPSVVRCLSLILHAFMTRPFELYVLMEALVQLKCFLDVSDYGPIRLI